MPVLHILEEASNHRGRNHVTHILRHIPPEPLKRHANNLVRLHHRSATVAGVDGGIDLDGKVRFPSGMRVRVVVDPTHHTPCHRQPIPPNGKAIHTNDRFQIRYPTNRQCRRSLEKLGILNLHQGQITVMRHMEDFRRILPRICLPLHRDIARTADHVGIRQNPIPLNHKPRSPTRTHGAGIPRQPIIPYLCGHFDHHDVLLSLAQLPVFPYAAREKRKKNQSQFPNPKSHKLHILSPLQKGANQIA